MLPLRLIGTVVRGAGRGGKQLNCPTANLDETTVKSIPDGITSGVYAGVACVDSDFYRPMVMSIGYNIQFEQKQKTAEVHLLHDFEKDFYNSRLEVIVLKFMRPMETYKSLEDLKLAIEQDKRSTLDYLKSNKESICEITKTYDRKIEW
ncbi:unnamed protein product [Bursaphelenchus xylophilus]|uniref:riboflavin kinase n=1 Tax=Bursaphelenchus xylophilus TaxID=6326 RepID=A0A1I7S3J3_BURXY|nr:unnamed protein product [Bursaphelenchus xylophilus]CAG9116348.1 unnamed protein product [Bursaphelenchus xylophilus]